MTINWSFETFTSIQFIWFPFNIEFLLIVFPHFTHLRKLKIDWSILVPVYLIAPKCLHYFIYIMMSYFVGSFVLGRTPIVCLIMPIMRFANIIRCETLLIRSINSSVIIFRTSMFYWILVFQTELKVIPRFSISLSHRFYICFYIFSQHSFTIQEVPSICSILCRFIHWSIGHSLLQLLYFILKVPLIILKTCKSSILMLFQFT